MELQATLATVIAASGEEAGVAAPVLRVLLYDEGEFDRTRMQRLLAASGRAMSVAACGSYDAFDHQIAQVRFDLILIASGVAAETEVELMTCLRASSLNRRVPAILLDPTPDIARTVQAMRAGFTDVLGKEALSSAQILASLADLPTRRETRPPHMDGAWRDDMAEQLVDQLARSAAERMKPTIRRIYSRIATLRGRDRLCATELASGLEEIETECMRLWQFLDDLDGHKAAFARRFL